MTNVNKEPHVIELQQLFGIPQGDKFIVGKIIEAGGNRFLDIRRHYKDKISSQLIPTSRGIRLTYKDATLLYELGVITPDFFHKVDYFMRENLLKGLVKM